ncbi:MAG TPA: hypothetical protein PKL57_20315, partial [Candidatus Wallbacteria bacterium]|nr:hypothetical protein [Candidatus Wallbacteria bacterium]
MTDSENNSKNMPQDGGAGDQLKKVQQQLVQKDNLIRLLQAQLKKQKDSPADSSSADHSVILANLEDEIKKLSGELKEKDSEISSFKRDREEFGAKYSELESEFNALKKQFEIVSEKQSDAIGESESKLTEELNDKISSLNESLRKKEEEIQKIKYKLESEIASSAKLKEALNENEIKLKQSQLETGSPDAGYATASKIIEKHIKGGKYLPEEYSKMIDLLS